jgi:hypothetical protein
MAYPYQRQIQAAERRYGLPPGLLAGLIDLESGFNAGAVSPAGAYGIGQIVPRYHGLTPAQALDPDIAIPAAAEILADDIRQCGTVNGGLKRYFSGRCNPPETSTDAFGTTPDGYVAAVLARARTYGYGSAAPAAPAAQMNTARPGTAVAKATTPGPAPGVDWLPLIAFGALALALGAYGVEELISGA